MHGFALAMFTACASFAEAPWFAESYRSISFQPGPHLSTKHCLCMMSSGSANPVSGKHRTRNVGAHLVPRMVHQHFLRHGARLPARTREEPARLQLTFCLLGGGRGRKPAAYEFLKGTRFHHYYSWEWTDSDWVGASRDFGALGRRTFPPPPKKEKRTVFGFKSRNVDGNKTMRESARLRSLVHYAQKDQVKVIY